MLAVEGPYFHSGSNIYRRVEITNAEEQFGDPDIRWVDSWMAMADDEPSARGIAEALNVRFSCAWEYSITGGDSSKSKPIPRRRMSFHSDWEDVPEEELPSEIKSVLDGTA